MDIHWTNYFAIITGIIGAVTGLISYRRTKRIKLLDMRIQLKKEIATLKADLKQIKPLLQKADTSRRDVAGLTGRISSSFMQNWNSEIKKDRQSISQIESKVDEFLPINYQHMKEPEMENVLIEIYTLIRDLQDYYKKYNLSLSEDDSTRKDLNRKWEERLKEERLDNPII